MVYVTHNRDDGWTVLEVFQVFRVEHFGAFSSFGFFLSRFYWHSHFGRHHCNGWHIEVLSQVNGYSLHKQPLDDFGIGYS